MDHRAAKDRKLEAAKEGHEDQDSLVLPFSTTVMHFTTPFYESRHSRESGNPGHFDPSNGNTALDARLRGHDVWIASLMMTKYVTE